MNKNFTLNRFNFSNLISYVQKTEVLPNILTDDETGIEFYGVNTVSRESLICFLTEFNLIDNLAQMDSKRKYENQVQYDIKNYQFEPSWAEIATNKVIVGYVGIYVNADFSLTFSKDNNKWILVSNWVKVCTNFSLSTTEV